MNHGTLFAHPPLALNSSFRMFPIMTRFGHPLQSPHTGRSTTPGPRYHSSIGHLIVSGDQRPRSARGKLDPRDSRANG